VFHRMAWVARWGQGAVMVYKPRVATEQKMEKALTSWQSQLIQKPAG